MYSESVLAPIPKMRNLSPGVFLITYPALCRILSAAMSFMNSTHNLPAMRFGNMSAIDGWYQFDCSFRCILCDSRNQIPRNLMPVLFGIIATTISICCGLNMGSPVNPASDFGGRIFASSVGYGVQLF
uniref:Aquaporin n=2 Tax=Onchocerca ochengi TaxID=42157 RepID=A0A182EKK1_ONCOC